MRRLAAIALLTATAVLAPADSSNLYHQLFATLESQIDLNAGLTVFPSLLIPAGGRLEGMGTAFTAVADDSGFIEANPAASASLAQSELSVLHNNWISDTRLESVVYTTRFDNLGLGAAAKVLYLPFTQYNSWGERSASAHISDSIATLNASYNFFSSYSFFGLSVGANVKAGYRSIPSVFATGQSALTVMADVGFVAPPDRWTPTMA
jgi:hypothetical protein